MPAIHTNPRSQVIQPRFARICIHKSVVPRQTGLHACLIEDFQTMSPVKNTNRTQKKTAGNRSVIGAFAPTFSRCRPAAGSTPPKKQVNESVKTRAGFHWSARPDRKRHFPGRPSQMISTLRRKTPSEKLESAHESQNTELTNGMANHCFPEPSSKQTIHGSVHPSTQTSVPPHGLARYRKLPFRRYICFKDARLPGCD